MKKTLKITVLGRKNGKFTGICSEKLLRQLNKYDKIVINLKRFEVDNLPDSRDLESTNEEVIFHISCQKHTEECEQIKGSQKRQERKTRVANVRDAANSLIKLYYYGNMNCTSAAVQKLLVIAQMKSLRKHGIPLFDDDLIVKPSCLSIDIISSTYPDIIFDESSRINLKDTDEGRLHENYNYEYKDNLPSLSGFYEVATALTNQEEAIIKDVYLNFGLFSGKCIGDMIRNLSIHNESITNNIHSISYEKLQEYVTNINGEDVNNRIIQFVIN